MSIFLKVEIKKIFIEKHCVNIITIKRTCGEIMKQNVIISTFDNLVSYLLIQIRLSF